MSAIKSISQVVAIMLITISCTKSRYSSDPSFIGQQTFNILKTINTSTLKSFKNYFITYDELLLIVTDSNSYRSHEEWLGVMEAFHHDHTEEKWANELLESFNKLKLFGIDEDIDWSQIKYREFVFEEEKSNRVNLKIYSGELFFTYKDLTNSVEVVFLGSDKGFILYEMSTPSYYNVYKE